MVATNSTYSRKAEYEMDILETIVDYCGLSSVLLNRKALKERLLHEKVCFGLSDRHSPII